MTFLAGDIGGTKTLLQIVEVQGVNIQVLHEQQFSSKTYDTFDRLLQEFLNQTTVKRFTLSAACIGVAGPIQGNDATVTNLPWRMNTTHLQQQCGIAQIRFINDFQAVGYGIEALREPDLVTLQTGQPVLHSVRAVIGAGTGLGEGVLIWQDDHYEAYPSEGGHVGFAPMDETQSDLLQFLRKRYAIVSYEHLVSGPGLGDIFDFVCDHWSTPLSNELQRALTQTDKAAAITQAALANSDEQAQRALDIFIRIYGAQAGNLALTIMARDGVYIAGGIAPKILPALQQGSFLAAFHDKGKMQHLMPGFPVHVITNAKVGVMGAALVASRMVE